MTKPTSRSRVALLGVAALSLAQADLGRCDPASFRRTAEWVLASGEAKHADSSSATCQVYLGSCPDGGLDYRWVELTAPISQIEHTFSAFPTLDEYILTSGRAGRYSIMIVNHNGDALSAILVGPDQHFRIFRQSGNGPGLAADEEAWWARSTPKNWSSQSAGTPNSH